MCEIIFCLLVIIIAVFACFTTIMLGLIINYLIHIMLKIIKRFCKWE
jgi:hypothetical protein